ncbi:hypothetical protein D3C87_1783030 [compost metagenome]
MSAKGKLVAVARGAVVVIAAVQIAAHFAGVIDFEVVAFFRKFCASAVPVAEHPGGVAIEGRGGLGAVGQAQHSETTDEAQCFSAGNRY